MKKCTQCDTEHNRNTKLCNKCYHLIPENREKRRKREKIYIKNNKEKVREIRNRAQFKYLYGIDKFNFEEIFKKQNYKCKICGITENDLSAVFCLDHNHNNLEIRGILCRSCNSGLGFFKDNVDSLRKAIDYLEVLTPHNV